FGSVLALACDVPLAVAIDRLQVQRDPRAVGRRGQRLERVLAVAARSPARALALAGAPGLDHDLARDHEARVEADAELADQLGRLPALRAQRLEELARARARDG